MLLDCHRIALGTYQGCKDNEENININLFLSLSLTQYSQKIVTLITKLLNAEIINDKLTVEGKISSFTHLSKTEIQRTPIR